MPSFYKKLLRNLGIFLVVLGPGLITAVADNDAGGIATYTVAAAFFGMASQYFVIPTTILLAITQEIGARLSIVTGEGLGSLIREKFGVRVALGLFIVYFFVNQSVVIQNIMGLKASLQLFGWPWQISLFVTCLLLAFLVIKLNFKKLQKIFLFMILFDAAYVVSAFLSHPNWAEAARESFVWPRQISVFSMSYWFTMVAVLGTTITAWGQFFISSYVADKGLKKEELKLSKIEVYGGAVITNFFSWMIAIAVTYTLFINRIAVTDGFTAALAIKPLAGPLALSLFALGLFGASLLGLVIVSLATAYVFTEMFGFERTLDTDFKTGRVFYAFFLVQIVIAFLAAIVPRLNLFDLTLYINYLNGAILPVIFYFLIKLSEDRELMGKYVSRGFTKLFVRAAAAVITLAVAGTFFGKFIAG